MKNLLTFACFFSISPIVKQFTRHHKPNDPWNEIKYVPPYSLDMGSSSPIEPTYVRD